MLWLDVEKGRDTTYFTLPHVPEVLWLDVEKGRDTTFLQYCRLTYELWLDVEKGRDTTEYCDRMAGVCCGLM